MATIAFRPESSTQGGRPGRVLSQSTVSCVVTVRVMLPLLAITVIEYVPRTVLLPAVTVSAEVPEVLIVLWLRVAESPFTSDTPSRVILTLPVKLKGVSAKL
jgi:hypothetical protein